MAYSFTTDQHGGAGFGMVLYVVTTLYLEVNDEDDPHKVEMSKERLGDPQIVVGLLVDSGGIPLEIHCSGKQGPNLHPAPGGALLPGPPPDQNLIVVGDARMV
ncbi:MAG: hypothetical protein QJR09_00035 [Micrococcus sp.]|nr:hypothetical protein [Micrococcus sp.]